MFTKSKSVKVDLKKRNNLLLPLNIKKDKNLVGDSRDTQLGTGMWRERVWMCAKSSSSVGAPLSKEQQRVRSGLLAWWRLLKSVFGELCVAPPVCWGGHCRTHFFWLGSGFGVSDNCAQELIKIFGGRPREIKMPEKSWGKVSWANKVELESQDAGEELVDTSEEAE